MTGGSPSNPRQNRSWPDGIEPEPHLGVSLNAYGPFGSLSQSSRLAMAELMHSPQPRLDIAIFLNLAIAFHEVENIDKAEHSGSVALDPA